MIVAFGQVEFLAVCGLRALLDIHERAIDQDCELALLAPSPSIESSR